MYWEAIWFHLMRFLKACSLALRLVAQYHQLREALERDVQFVKNSLLLQEKYIRCLQKMESHIIEADLHFPTARKVLMELTLMLMQELVRTQEQKLHTTSQNPNEHDKVASESRHNHAN